MTPISGCVSVTVMARRLTMPVAALVTKSSTCGDTLWAFAVGSPMVAGGRATGATALPIPAIAPVGSPGIIKGGLAGAVDVKDQYPPLAALWLYVTDRPVASVAIQLASESVDVFAFALVALSMGAAVMPKASATVCASTRGSCGELNS
jgi:hypothetical protein